MIQLSANDLRKSELEAALVQGRADISAGRAIQETADAHMKRLEAVLKAKEPKVDASDLLKPKRGRPPLPSTKRHINLRIDEDIIQAFQQSGQGWQTRMNMALRE